MRALSKEQTAVLRQGATEPPFSGALLNNKEEGLYICAGCGAALFSSATKYDSGSGWPSFYDAIKDKVETRLDQSHGQQRVEVICRQCGGHLGHVFEDGPKDKTGQRYCINSLALDFTKDSFTDSAK